MQPMRQSVGAKGLDGYPSCFITWVITGALNGNHFSAVLFCQPRLTLPAVIYNSPYYGFATRADLFFDLALLDHSNLIGFKEFGGANDMRYAAENITSQDDNVTLMIGVDTAVYHGYVNCGATGAITGIGNVLPREVLHLVTLCNRAAAGDHEARNKALELEAALGVLSSFDEGPDLVLYYKHLMVMTGDDAYRTHFNETDQLTAAQRNYAESQFELFQNWYANWSKQGGVIAECA